VSGDPQVAVDRRIAARSLVQRPLTCAEHDLDTFRLIRRHEAELDRWFTQRFGYRLHVDADTARLFKSGVLLEHHPLVTSSGRPLHQLEYVLLALVLASTAAGPSVISLRDLIDEVRSAAAEAEITLTGDATERRALVAVLKWMIDHGLAVELHAHVDAYAADDTADAVLKVRPDRIALVPLPDLVAAEDRQELLARADRRSATRQWVRTRLVEDPVVYRDDFTDAEWAEVRRRLGEEERILHEMFGLVLEARAEGMAAIDPTGALSARRFPAGGTLGHAALLLLDALRGEPAVPTARVYELVAGLTLEHADRWSNDLVAAPERLARDVVGLLVELRLGVVETSEDGEPWFRLLPGAARFRPEVPADTGAQQESLW
jgi:uncharacterized protein (TIGR02678 family)